jgi:oxalate decarboxylase/phosphoglucose isomerase-like protein (cupin superfamily)
MGLIPTTPDFTDDRGTIMDLLNHVNIRHIGFISSKAGAVRGNHFHKEASQYTYIISGKMEITSRDPDGEPESIVISKGDLFLDPPLTEHAMRFIEDTEILVFTTIPRDEGGYEDDTVRLENPLV